MIRALCAAADGRKKIVSAGLERVLMLQSLELDAFLIPAAGIRTRWEQERENCVLGRSEIGRSVGTAGEALQLWR